MSDSEKKAPLPKLSQIEELKAAAILAEVGVDQPYDLELAISLWRKAALLRDPWALLRLKQLRDKPEYKFFFTQEDDDLIAGKHRRGVIIADDDTAIRQEIANALGHQLYRIKLTGDGEETLKLLRDDIIDVLILDLKMPKADGFTVLSYVRDKELHIPTIVCTGYASPANIERLHSLGAVKVLKKPFQKEELLDAIKELW